MSQPCPICSTPLKPIRAAPCFDCGHASSELDECVADSHEYHLFRIWGEEIVLCDFCDADFGSYYPDYWGLSGNTPGEQSYELELLEKLVSPRVSEDLYCPSCERRLAFLRFRAAVLSRHAS